VITKGICERIAQFDGTTNDIILPSSIAGIGPLLNITAMETPAALTKGKAGAELTGASVISCKYPEIKQVKK
jgi:hypothetical protein